MIITPLAPDHRRHFQRINNNILVQRAQTGRGKFISNINDHLGLKPAVSIVTIATREYERKTRLAQKH